MCVGLTKKCVCGEKEVFIHNESVLPYDVILEVRCPSCGNGTAFDADTMVNDNGWIIKYDMNLAVSYHNRLNVKPERITPEFLFDYKLSSWNGYTPTEIKDKIDETGELRKLAKTDPKKYFEDIKRWNKERLARLKKEGWRKAENIEV